MENSDSIKDDTPLDQSTETEVEDSPIENSIPESGNDSGRTKSSSNYFSSLTWNFDTVSGVLAIAFIALGTCMMYFQNSIKLGSYLLGIAVLIGLFNSFVRVYLPGFTLGNRSRKGSSNADSSQESSTEPTNSSTSSESSESE